MILPASLLFLGAPMSVAVVVALARYRRNFFKLLPIARSALLDAMPDAALVLDRRGMIVEANLAARALEGMQPGPVGRMLAAVPVWQQALHHPEHSAAGDIGRVIADAEQKHHYEVRSIPLTYRDERVGQLVILRDVTLLTAAQQRLQRTLEALRTQLAHNRSLLDTMREQTVRDPLTGLYNRRFLDDARPVLVAEAQYTDDPLAVVVIDLDHFKQVNDELGHDHGDAVLRAFAAHLLGSKRRNDMAIRLGGEEFLVVLPGTLAQQARARADAWRERFAELAARTWPGRPVTFSAGVAAYPQDATDWETLVRRADQALYESKARGRNCVTCWADLQPQPQPGDLPPSISLSRAK